MRFVRCLRSMGLLPGGKGRETRLQRLFCPSWRGALLRLSYLLYVVLAGLCLTDGFAFAAPHDHAALPAGSARPHLLQAARVVLQFWSVGLLFCVCRGRLAVVAGKVAGALTAHLVGGPGGGGERPQRAKTTRTGAGPGFSYVSCEMQGWRPYMEDAVVCAPYLDEPEGQPPQQQQAQQVPAPEDPSSCRALFAVMDGHGGSEVSARVAELLVGKVRSCLATVDPPGDALRWALLEIEDDLRRSNGHGRWRQMGCTAAVTLVTPTMAFVASVGDSRVFKCRRGRVVPLTRDHKPESPKERRRIEAAGGTVAKFGPCYRVDACLNMSRALGDFLWKDPNQPHDQQKISPTPDVTISELDEDDEFLVVACDGLFELMTWETVCQYIHERIWTRPLSEIAEGLLDACCTDNHVVTGGRGTDNESVIIVKLNRPAHQGETTSLMGSPL